MTEVSCQVVTASTLFGAATVAAAWDSGALPRRERTVLVVQHNVTVPEASDDFTHGPAFAALADRFDAVVAWNDVVAPYHPKEWSPRDDDAPLWERLLRVRWELGDGPLELVGESVATSPTAALTRIFGSAAVTVYADGLMVYGPTRFPLDHATGGRVDRVLHLDLLPGVRPTLLAEWDVPGVVVPAESFRKIVGSLTEHALACGDAPSTLCQERAGVRLADHLPAAGDYALVLGQYMAAIGLISEAEESALHRRMVSLAAERGYRTVLLKPHPSAPRQGTEELVAHARTVGVDLEVAPAAVLAESLYGESAPGLVVSCFSTALATARSVYDIEVAAVGTDLLLDRLEPYPNSNRVPAVVVDALWGPDGPWTTDPGRLELLVRGVSYCQQPALLGDLREQTVELLTARDAQEGTLDDARLRRWFRRRRLTTLGLPGGLPVPRTTRLLRWADSLDRRLLGGRLRRLARRRFAGGGDDLRAALGAARTQVDGDD
ncbi:polysialyltransferase family glycosyltransferase [Isoptericola jiangsuensis]|uniref:polysialyltransferase family glycosyltransferase n=1 Tax=Isoptericola jiangsuensis TaxID=548579 RepID=UPI003AB09874